MYCGIVEVPKKKLEEVLHAAKHLQIKGLFNTSNYEETKRIFPTATKNKYEKDEFKRSAKNVMETKNTPNLQNLEAGQNVCYDSSSSMKLSQEISCTSNLMSADNSEGENLSKHPLDFARTKDTIKRSELEKSDIVSTSFKPLSMVDFLIFLNLLPNNFNHYL